MRAGWSAGALAESLIANTGRNREVLAEAGAGVRRVPRFDDEMPGAGRGSPPVPQPSGGGAAAGPPSRGEEGEPGLPALGQARPRRGGAPAEPPACSVRQEGDTAPPVAAIHETTPRGPGRASTADHPKARTETAAAAGVQTPPSDRLPPAALATIPWRHQREAADFALARKAALLNMGMGTGKSLSAIAVACEGDARLVVILCPVSVVGVWRREFVRHAPGAFDVRCLDGGTCAAKAGTLREQVGLAKARGRRLVLVCNYESAWRPDLAKALLALVPDLIIMDEGHRIKSPSGKASRFCERLARQSRRRLDLTGTPAPHSPLDLFAQFRALDPGVFGRSFVAFRARYALCDPKFPSRVLRWLNQDELRAKYRTITYECSSESVLDLPPVTEQTITVQLSPRARRAYDRLEAEFWTEVDKGEVTAANALTKLLRLAQITSGSIPLDDGTVAQVDDAKKRALADFLEDVPADVPVVVFCRFVADLDAVREAASACGRTYAEISGRSKEALDQHACLKEGVGLVGVQTQSGGVGIDLTRAAVAVFYSLGFSLGDFLQARARLHRPGQTRHVTFINLVAEDTVDETVIHALERRQQVIETVLGSRNRRAAA